MRFDVPGNEKRSDLLNLGDNQFQGRFRNLKFSQFRHFALVNPLSFSHRNPLYALFVFYIQDSTRNTVKMSSMWLNDTQSK